MSLFSVPSLSLEGRSLIAHIIHPMQTAGVRLRSFLQTGPDSVRWKMQNVSETRFAGWNLRTTGGVELVGGQILRAKLPGRTVIEVHRNGLLLFVGAADTGFYAWPPQNGALLNSLALTEATYNFLSFYNEITYDFEGEPPEEYLAVIRLLNLRQGDEITSLAIWKQDEERNAAVGAGQARRTGRRTRNCGVMRAV